MNKSQSKFLTKHRKFATRFAENGRSMQAQKTFQYLETIQGSYYMPYSCDSNNWNDIAVTELMPRLRSAIHSMLNSTSVTRDTKAIYTILYRLKLANIEIPYSIHQSLQRLCNIGVLQIHTINEILFSAEKARVMYIVE